MSLVLELQKDAMESHVPITDLLRKAMVLAKKLEIKELEEWIARELGGYTDGKTVPEYRQVHGEIRVHNPYQGWQPVLIHDNEMAQMVATRPVFQPISEIEHLYQSSEKGILRFPLPPDAERMLMEMARLPFQPIYCVDRSQLHGVLDAVRNAVLTWALKLEQEGVLGENMTFSAEEKKKAKTNVNIKIKNFKGILGDVTGSTVNQDFRVEKGDWKSLEKLLKAQGVGQQDVADLQMAIKSDGKPKEQGSFGANVGEWMGRMTTKAASGVWKIPVDVGVALLASAIGKYFGWSV